MGRLMLAGMLIITLSVGGYYFIPKIIGPEGNDNGNQTTSTLTTTSTTTTSATSTTTSSTTSTTTSSTTSTTTSSTSGTTTTTTPTTVPYVDISVRTAHDMIMDPATYPDLLILDVRTQSEYDTNHIEGAILIPHGELATRIRELRDYKDTEIIVYCGSGYRSAIAAEILEGEYFTKVYNMLGGFAAWLGAGYQPL